MALTKSSARRTTDFSTSAVLRTYNEALRGFAVEDFEASRVVSRHYLETSGVVRRQVEVTIVARRDGANSFLWRIPLHASSHFLGAWPQPAPTIIHSLTVVPGVTLGDKPVRYVDLAFELTAMEENETATLSFEAIIASASLQRRRHLVPMENEIYYALAHKAQATPSLAIFVHLPEGVSGYFAEHTFPSELLYKDHGRAVLAFVDEDYQGRDPQAIALLLRTKNELAPTIVTILFALAIALVQISVRGYTFVHTVVALVIAALGAVAIRLAVPRAFPRNLRAER